MNGKPQDIQPEEEYSDNPTSQEKKRRVVENTSEMTSTRKEGSTHLESFIGNVTIGYFKPLQKYVWP